MGKSNMSMAMFNSYISLPEGIYNLYGNGESLKKKSARTEGAGA